MNDENLTLEVVYQIWNDTTGDRIEIGPDRDGLDLIELRQYGADSHKAVQRITFTQTELEKLHTAIGKILGS